MKNSLNICRFNYVHSPEDRLRANYYNICRSSRPVRHALDNTQKCVPTQNSVFGQTGGNEMEERGTGSEEEELQVTLYKGTRNNFL
jgi:hypothetical protein